MFLILASTIFLVLTCLWNSRLTRSLSKLVSWPFVKPLLPPYSPLYHYRDAESINQNAYLLQQYPQLYNYVYQVYPFLLATAMNSWKMKKYIPTLSVYCGLSLFFVMWMFVSVPPVHFFAGLFVLIGIANLMRCYAHHVANTPFPQGRKTNLLLRYILMTFIVLVLWLSIEVRLMAYFWTTPITLTMFIAFLVSLEAGFSHRFRKLKILRDRERLFSSAPPALERPAYIAIPSDFPLIPCYPHPHYRSFWSDPEDDVDLTEYDFFSDPVGAQGLQEPGKWKLKFKDMPTVKCDVWNFLTNDYAKELKLPYSLMRAIFKGEPKCYASQAATYAGVPYICSGSELRELMIEYNFEINIGCENNQDQIQKILDQVHKSHPGRLARVYQRLYSTAFTKYRMKYSETRDIMQKITDNWPAMVRSLDSARRVQEAILASKLSRKRRPVRSSAAIVESMVRSTLSASSSTEASSSSEPQPDDDALRDELQEFQDFADKISVNRVFSGKKDTREPRPLKFTSAKKTAKSIAKELRRFKDERDLDDKYRPVRPQGPVSSWISVIISTLQSKNFHFGLHFCALISSAVILACKEETVYRIGATLVGANSLVSLYQLWSKPGSIPIGLMSCVPQFIKFSKNLVTRLARAGPIILSHLLVFFKSLLKTIVSLDPTGMFQSFFDKKEMPISNPSPSAPAPPDDHDDVALAAQIVGLDPEEFRKTLDEHANAVSSPIPSSSTDTDDALPQFFGFVDFFKSLAIEISTLICGELDSKVLWTRVRNFTLGCIAVRHAKDVFHNIQLFVIHACNWISVKLTGVAFFDDSGLVFAKAVDRLSVESPEFMRVVQCPTSKSDEIARALEWASRLRALYFANLHRDPMDAGMKELLRLYQGFAKVQSQFVGKLSETTSRVEPTGVLLLGTPGIGKTAFLKYLIKILHDLNLTTNTLTYPRLPNSDYEEGLRDQAHYIFDEFMTVNDKESRVEHARHLLSLINVAPRPINYASVENKGVHFDKSEFVWCTTNAKPHAWRETLADATALTRRFALQITPVPPAEGIPVTSSGNIDWSKFTFLTRTAQEAAANSEERPRSLSEIVQVLADARLSRIAHHKATQDEKIEDLRAQVPDYAGLKAWVQERQQNVRPQGAGGVVLDKLFVLFSQATPRHCEESATWKDIMKDALENIDNPLYQPRFLCTDIPSTPGEYDLALLYARITHDVTLKSAIRAVIQSNVERRKSEFAAHSIPPPPDPEALPPKSYWCCGSIRRKIDYLKLKLQAFTFTRVRSILSQYLSAAALPIFATCLGIASVAISVIIMLKSLFSSSASNRVNVNVNIPSPFSALSSIYPQSARDKEERIRMRKANVIRARNVALRNPHPPVKAQAHDPTFSTLAASSYCYLHFSSLLPGHRAVGIKDNFIITNHHVLKGMDTLTEIEVSTIHGRYKVQVKDILRIDDAEDDLVLLQLPKTIPQFPNIVHRFIQDSDLPTLGSCYVRAIAQNHKIGLEWCNEYVEPNLLAYIDDDSESYHPYGLSLPLPGIAGDCGTLVATFASSLNSRNLLGIHCAGNDTCSQYTLVTQELLQILFDQVTTPQGYKVALTKIPELQKTHEAVASDPSMSYLLLAPPQAKMIGTITPSDHIPRNTKLVPSLVCSKLGEPKRAPAILSSSKDPLHRDPLVQAYNRMKRLDPVELPPWFQDCADQVFRFVKNSSVPRRMLTKKEAILGIGNLPPMVLDTSAGYPWTHHPDAKAAHSSLKSVFIKIENGNLWIHPDLDIAIDDDLAKLKKGELPEWYFSDKLKDELVSVEKIADCKTRVFMAAPIVNHIIGRMLFGSIIQASDESRMRHPGQSSCAVGTLPRDLNITAMYQQLTGDEFEVHAHDQKGFDFHQQEPQALCVGHSINQWYNESPSTSTARLTYIRACYNSVHVSGMYVYALEGHGMPSGVVFTAHFNSWVLEADTLSVIHKVSRQQYLEGKVPSVRAPRQIKKAIFALYYGDDSWIAIPRNFMVIEPSSFFSEYRELGLETTHCVKDFPIDQCVPKSEITFLKRKVFQNEDGYVVFALEKEHIYDMLNYIFKGYLTSAPLYNSTARNMLTEISLYGRREFNELATRMKSAFVEANLDLTISVDFNDYL